MTDEREEREGEGGMGNQMSLQVTEEVRDTSEKGYFGQFIHSVLINTH